MVGKSKIEWTQQTYNPIVGCSIVSPGCTNCYAMKMAARIEAMGNQPRYAGTTRKVNGNAIWTGKIAQAPRETLLAPLRRKIPTTYFVNSMSDLFHEDIPDEWIDQIFAVMALTPHHTYQVLTKRPARMREYFMPTGCVNCGDGQSGGNCCGEPYVLHGDAAFRDALIEGAAQSIYATLHPGDDPSMWLAVHMPLSNVWLGVSAERQQEADERIPYLLETPAAVRFISAEPLLGPIDLLGTLARYQDNPKRNCAVPLGRQLIDWVIAGGESSRGARPMHPDWPRMLRDQCAAAGIAYFFKQWGEWLAGEVYSEGNNGGFARHQDGSERSHSGKRDHWWSGDAFGGVISTAVGKAKAGRLLDGVEHNGMPRSAA